MNQAMDISKQSDVVSQTFLIIGAGQFASQLSFGLKASGIRNKTLAECPDDLTGCSAVVIAHDVVDRRAVLAITRRCLDAGVPCLPVLLMGEVAQIGPMARVEPATACVACADSRMVVSTGNSGLDAAWPMSDELCANLAPVVSEVLSDWAAAGERYTNCLSFVWSNGGQSFHKVMRTVACPVCAEVAPHMPFRHPVAMEVDPKVRPDQSLILRLERDLVDDLTGPITSVAPLEQPEGLPTICHAVATLVDPGWARNGHATLDCGGNELDPTSARAAALGEAIERASASEVWPGHLTAGRWSDLSDRAVNPRMLDLFLPSDRAREGFPYAAADHDEQRHWVWATDLARRTPVLVPASHVFVPFAPPTPEPTVDYPLLSGFAAGATRESALLSALLEVIERDSFMIAWANQLALQPIALNDGGPLEKLHGVFAKLGIEVRVGVLQLDLGAPTAIAIARSDQQGHPATVVSAAAAMSPGRAAEKALGELTANWLNVHHTMGVSPLPAGPDPALIRDETAHALLYARADMVGALDFWWHSDAAPLRVTTDVRDSQPPGQSCQELTAAMAHAGLSPMVVDLTMPALSDLGLYTVKAIVPGTYPMNFDSLWPQLGGPRMIEAPLRAGLRLHPTAEAGLNRLPHPFP